MSAPKGNKYGLRHGGRYTRLYRIWIDMRRRCRDSNRSDYKYYCRINICPEWNSFVAFREWSLSNGYNETLCIHRKDNKGDYTPDNCSWLTKAEHNTIHKMGNEFWKERRGKP